MTSEMSALSTTRSTPASAAGLPVMRTWERIGRVLLLMAGISGLVTGILGGLTRLPVLLPGGMMRANWVELHGPLMVCGFLGTLIGIERSVGLGLRWTWGAPLLSALAGVSLAAGIGGAWPQWLLVMASAWFVLVSWKIDSIQPGLSNVVMALGAVAWMVGNIRWAMGGAVPVIAPWWMAFLVLTILGERIQLTRYRKPSKWARPMLLAALAPVGVGLACGSIDHADAQRAGGLMFGTGLAGLAGWLITFDIARVTIKYSGLPRFMAVCLLGGYGWLFAGGALFAWNWPSQGYHYDMCLHAVFVGFVFSMIFGHAPVIFPAVLGLPVRFTPWSYLPVGLTHGFLLTRIVGDLLFIPSARAWGGAGNAVAVIVFIAITVSAVVRGTMILTSSRRAKPRSTQP